MGKSSGGTKRISSGRVSRDKDRRKGRERRKRKSERFRRQLSVSLESLQALGKYAPRSGRVLCISVRIARQRYRIDSRETNHALPPTFPPCSDQEYSPGEKN